MSAKYILELIAENEHLPVYFTPVECAPLIIPPHWHTHLELVFFLSGNMNATIQGQSYKLSAGTLMIVNSREIHMTATYGISRYLLLQIPMEQIQGFLPNFDQIRFQTLIEKDDSNEHYRELSCHLTRMHELFLNKEDGFQLQFTSHLYALLHKLYQHYTSNTDLADKYGVKRDFKRITKTISWINQNFSASLSLDEAAANLDISKEYFCRLFKKCTGQTFLEYIYTVRATNFYEDLKKTTSSITLLLEKNGITNYKLFMRTFKKLYNDTPYNIRRQFL